MRYWKSKKIKNPPLVSIVIAAYVTNDREAGALSCLLGSLRAQTYPYWEAVVVHDGKMLHPAARHAAVCAESDPRISVFETPERKAKFGHPWRKWGVEAATGSIVGMTNFDNYFVPTYLEALVDKIVNCNADIAFCDIVHSHLLWRPMVTRPKRGKIDLSCWLARRELVDATEWRKYEFAGDWFFLEDMLKRGVKVEKVDHFLVVHN